MSKHLPNQMPELAWMSTDAVKFDLFVKNRELEQISSSLKSVMLLPDGKRHEWIADNEEYLQQLVEGFMDDSLMSLDGIKMDREALDLSVDVVSRLREVMHTLQQMLASNRPLTG